MGREHLVGADIIKTFKIQNFQADYVIEMDPYYTLDRWWVMISLEPS